MKKLRALLLMEFQHFSEYRGDIFVYTMGAIVIPVVLLNVWLAIADAKGSNASEIQYLVQYFVVQVFVNVIVSTWQATFLANAIQRGEISAHLLKPYPYIMVHIANNISEKVWKILFSLVALVILVAMYHSYLTIPLWQTILPGSLVVLLGAVIKFMWSQILGMSGFWTSNIYAIREYNQMLYNLISGVLFPIKYATQVIPAFVFVVLPYQYMLGFPINVLLGKVSQTELFQGVGIQLIWVIVLYIVYRIVWQKGLQRYGGYGG